MWNYTQGADKWATRLDGFLNSTVNVLFPQQYNANRQLLVEISCEVHNTCDTDQPSFKAYMVRHEFFLFHFCLIVRRCFEFAWTLLVFGPFFLGAYFLAYASLCLVPIAWEQKKKLHGTDRFCFVSFRGTRGTDESVGYLEPEPGQDCRTQSCMSKVPKAGYKPHAERSR